MEGAPGSSSVRPAVLMADVRIASLAQWGALQAQMATVPNVSGVECLRWILARRAYRLPISATPEQLRDALSAQRMSLTKTRRGNWRSPDPARHDALLPPSAQYSDCAATVRGAVDGRISSSRARFAAALCVFAFAGLSDVLDGYFARRAVATRPRFGVYLDPAADKLLMLASFVTLTMIHASRSG